MKIFVCHSSNFDFRNELYIPLRQSALNEKHEIILPQEKGPEPTSRDIIKECNVLVAEVSYPSTGAGIEIGWADIFQKPIICIYKEEEGNKISNSLKKVTDIFIPYQDTNDMIQKLTAELESHEKTN